MSDVKDSGSAVIEGDSIVIRVAIEALPTILDGVGTLWDEEGEPRFQVTDPAAFAAEIVRSLNDEREDGTTRIHRMFDEALDHAVEYGDDQGIEEIGS